MSTLSERANMCGSVQYEPGSERRSEHGSDGSSDGSQLRSEVGSEILFPAADWPSSDPAIAVPYVEA